MPGETNLSLVTIIELLLVVLAVAVLVELLWFRPLRYRSSSSPHSDIGT